MINKNLNSRKAFTHLYNPNEEGLGSYDVHYINAYKKDRKSTNIQKSEDIKRYVA